MEAAKFSETFATIYESTCLHTMEDENIHTCVTRQCRPTGEETAMPSRPYGLPSLPKTAAMQYYPLGTLRPIYRTGVKLPSRCPILYIYSTNIRTEYF